MPLLRPTPRAALIGSAILITGISLLIDLHLTLNYAGVDLRDKVVGARSLMEGRSLYFEPWRPGDPERLADPMVPPGATMTRYTGTPFQALVLAPLGALPFSAARTAWLFVQYALLLTAFALPFRAFRGGGPRATVIATAVLLVVLGSTSWHLHVERGQVYVLFAAIIAGLFACLARGHDLCAGALGAALVLFKPTYAVMLAPVLLRATPRMLAGGAGLLAAALLVFALLPDGLRSWMEYREAMRMWSTFIGEGEPPTTDPRAFTYPAAIEGAGDLTGHHPMEFENGSVTATLHALGLVVPGWAPWALFGAFAVVLATVLGRGLLRASRADLLLLGFCCWTVLMVLLPVPRFNYQVVHWIAPVVFVLLTYRDRPFVWNTLMAGAGALMLGAWSMLPVNVLLAEGILLGLFMAVLVRRVRTSMA